MRLGRIVAGNAAHLVEDDVVYMNWNVAQAEQSDPFANRLADIPGQALDERERYLKQVPISIGVPWVDKRELVYFKYDLTFKASKESSVILEIMS